MEPLFFKAENGQNRMKMIKKSLIPRFNGAAFFQSGKRWDTRSGPRSRVGCFNGAAFFQSGKRRPTTQVLNFFLTASMEPLFFKAENSMLFLLHLASKLASMEPLFFKAENAEGIDQRLDEGLALQWSRFFSKRKTGYTIQVFEYSG